MWIFNFGGCKIFHLRANLPRRLANVQIVMQWSWWAWGCAWLTGPTGGPCCWSVDLVWVQGTKKNWENPAELCCRPLWCCGVRWREVHIYLTVCSIPFHVEFAKLWLIIKNYSIEEFNGFQTKILDLWEAPSLSRINIASVLLTLRHLLSFWEHSPAPLFPVFVRGVRLCLRLVGRTGLSPQACR